MSATIISQDGLAVPPSPHCAPASIPLLQGLRDLHRAEAVFIRVLGTTAQWDALRGESEEQWRRLEYACAELRQSPSGGDLKRLGAYGAALRRLRPRDPHALQQALDMAAAHYAVLRRAAHDANQHGIARLLDLTLQEKRASARKLAAM